MTDTNRLITNTTTECLVNLAAENKIEFDSVEMGGKIAATCKEWFPRIVAVAKADAQKADILDRIKKGKIDPLVAAAFSISLKAECLKYAQFLLDIKPA